MGQSKKYKKGTVILL